MQILDQKNVFAVCMDMLLLLLCFYPLNMLAFDRSRTDDPICYGDMHLRGLCWQWSVVSGQCQWSVVSVSGQWLVLSSEF